ncbi:LysR family transcriptional regulator [Pectobacterium versatile]|uniref:LysR family transcriptional regulator n=1 Tax=Pectobacterium versatile TaxID=2488639 RepID=UPI0015DF0FF1|nr:LysR family transcriptional regulator [Pectobacterium versatile]MBA0162918.1 LysR family transcriptional regulator [Pectobacterium versatile]MBN3058478.1 LysR family transcriptional regulator [Pectobacterium versatile]
MSLKALRTLVAIAQYGSFARAAEAVCLTQSAVSLHVRSLEEDFKVSLFDRSRRIPVLTEAGHRAVEQARDILAQYDGIAAELGEGGELAGRLRIGAIQTALAGVLPAALAALRRAHPRLRVLVNSGMSAELAIRIDAGELDAAVTTEPVKPYPTGLVSTPLYQEGFWIVAPLALASLDARQLLQDRPFIRFDRRAWAGRTIDRELRRQRLRVQTDMELDSQDAIIQMVASGLGVAVIPLSEREKNRLDNLVCIPFGEPQQQRRVVLLECEDRPAARLAAALAEAIRTQSGDDVIHEK